MFKNLFYYISILALFSLSSCQKTDTKNQNDNQSTIIIEENYELYKSSSKSQAVLILFGGFGEVAKDIRREFKIFDIAKQNNITVFLLNYTKKLWLEEKEKKALAEDLKEIFSTHQLPTDNFYIGGFSSGGVVSFHISNYLMLKKEFQMQPKGVFMIDSPIDLAVLYEVSEKNIAKNFSEVSVQESTWLIEFLEGKLGKPQDSLNNYEKYAIYTSKTDYIDNLKALKNTKLRFYTEADTLWWKKNRMAEYNETNAFYIKKLSQTLQKEGFKKVEYIESKNKGYRANGERHPHSWSIVDTKKLIDWILER